MIPCILLTTVVRYSTYVLKRSPCGWRAGLGSAETRPRSITGHHHPERPAVPTASSPEAQPETITIVRGSARPGPVGSRRTIPDPSGAYPPYPLNHTFDAGITNLGNPTNYDFETAASIVGTPTTNHTFATGDYTGWTTSGGPLGLPTIVATGGPDGPYARLQAGTAITSSAFTL